MSLVTSAAAIVSKRSCKLTKQIFLLAHKAHKWWLFVLQLFSTFNNMQSTQTAFKCNRMDNGQAESHGQTCLNQIVTGLQREDLGLGSRTGDRQQKGRKQPPHTHRERHAQTHEGMQTHAHREMCILMMCYLNPLLNCSSTYVFVLLHFSSFRLWLLCC